MSKKILLKGFTTSAVILTLAGTVMQDRSFVANAETLENLETVEMTDEQAEEIVSVFSQYSKVQVGKGDTVIKDYQENFSSPIMARSVLTEEYTPYTFRVDLNGYWAQGQMPILRIDGEVVFCIEPGVAALTGSGYSPKDLSPETQELLSKIGAFSYNIEPTAEMYVTGQGMTWEKQSATFTTSYSGYESDKMKVNERIARFDTKASFDGQNITLNVDESVTLTDTRGVLSDYVDALASDGISWSISGNALTITANANASKSSSLKLRKNVVNGVSIAYIKEGSQTVAKFVNSDPGIATINLKVNKLGDLKIRKIDKATGKVLPNTKFKVTLPDGTTSERTTDANGEIDIKGITVTAGAKAIVEEIEAPFGYTTTHEKQEITLVANEVATAVFSNNTQKGALTINKTKEAPTSAVSKETEYGTDYDFVLTQVNTADAEFSLIAKEDIKTPEGTVYFKAGEVAKSGITATDGKLVLDGLQLGKYELIETKAPLGQVLDDTRYEVNFEYAGQEIDVVEGTQNVQNMMQEIEIVTHKDDENYKGFEENEPIYADEKSENKIFGLFTDEDYIYNDEVIIPADSLLAVAETKEGIAEVQEKLPEMKYYIQELKAGEDHVLDTTKHEFVLDYSLTGDDEIYSINIYKDTVLFEGEEPEKELEPILNKHKKGTVEFTKYDSTTDDTLAHVSFEVLDKDMNVVVYKKTDAYGKLILDDLPANKQFYLREKASLFGYVLDQTLIPFMITEDEQVIELEMKNDRVVEKDKETKTETIVQTVKQSTVLPNTGESNNRYYTIAGATLLGSLGGYALYRNNKKKKRDKV